uniref:Alpha-carbonic anhydrase domain-containing protein n=1 Tax=Heterorhabditis bacteriophora TaxID=37862 RepID=A0A1I7WPY4_HETBA
MAKTIAPPQTKRAIPSRPRRACTVRSVQTQRPGTSKVVSNAQKRKKKPKISATIRKVTFKKTKKIGGTLAKGVFEKLPITQRRQSPIDIKSDVISHDPDYCKVDSLNISYTLGDCHDVICDNGGFRHKYCVTLAFSANHLPGTFELAQFHAHWSNDGSCGSEHRLDGKAMSGEVHFVYWNTKYGSFCEAVEKDDGLAVIGVFIKVIDISLLLPHQLIYRRSCFASSLHEILLNILRKIVATNYRECQDLCERVVRTSRGIKAQ